MTDVRNGIPQRERDAYRDLLTRMIDALKARHTLRDSAMAGMAQATLDQFADDKTK